MLDLRTSQNQLEDLLRDAILYALGRRKFTADTVAELRSFATNSSGDPLLSDDDLSVIYHLGVVTAAYRWSQKSTASDNGTTVIKPDDVSRNGRWVLWTSDIRFSPEVGGPSMLLHEIQQGPLHRVIVIDKSMDHDEVSRLLNGQVPSVFIEATNDSPSDYTFSTGFRYDTEYGFTISVLAQNLRDRRESTHGSSLENELGANTLDGLIKALIAGTNLCPEESGIRNIQIGQGRNSFSSEGQRRVIRSRDFLLQVTESNPQAPNEAAAVERVDSQAELTDLGEHADSSFDMDNYVSEGMEVRVGPGLTKTVSVGAGFIDGDPVSYAGELVTFAADKDIYRDLMADGTMVFIENDADQAEPAVTTGAMRIGRTRTDSSGVLSDVMLARTREPYLNPVQTPLL